jgi:hypothetical protein
MGAAAYLPAHVASRPVPHQKTNTTHPHQGRWHAAHRPQWQRACELLLAEADIDDFSKQLELALFYDAKLVLA